MVGFELGTLCMASENPSRCTLPTRTPDYLDTVKEKDKRKQRGESKGRKM
jgi:hypothetical protein